MTKKKSTKKPVKKSTKPKKKATSESSVKPEAERELTEAEKGVTPERLERLDKVEAMKLQGYTAAQIAGAYNVSTRQIEEDVTIIKKRNKERYEKYNVDEEAAWILAQYEQMRSNLYTTHAGAPKNVQVNAVQTAAMILRDQIKMMQLMGRLPKDAIEEENKQPVHVFFNIGRPDRSKQIKKQTNGSKQ